MKKPQKHIISMIEDFGGIDSFKIRVRCMRRHSGPEYHDMLNNIITYYDLMFKIDIDVVADLLKYGEMFEENQIFFNAMSVKYPECELTAFYLKIIDYKKTLIHRVIPMA